MRLPIGLLFLLAGIALSGASLAADPAGSAVAVNPQATGVLEGATAIKLSTGDSVFLGQTIVTGNSGQVQIVFSDDTHLIVGPNSNLVIAEYLMRNETTASKVVINALGGTFRFITGNSPKKAYQINTPTGTMGVRGTEFDFTVMRKGSEGPAETSVLLYHGKVRLCGQANCQMLLFSCDVGVVQGLDKTSILPRGDEKRATYLGGFPYLTQQASLQKPFRTRGMKRCADFESAPRPGLGIFSKDASTASTASVPGGTTADAPAPTQTNGKDNKGVGNGGDSSSEGDTETSNPGKGNGNN